MVKNAEVSGLLKSGLALMTPNPALHPTAKRLSCLVPSSLRLSAVGEGKRYTVTR